MTWWDWFSVLGFAFLVSNACGVALMAKRGELFHENKKRFVIGPSCDACEELHKMHGPRMRAQSEAKAKRAK